MQKYKGQSNCGCNARYKNFCPKPILHPTISPVEKNRFSKLSYIVLTYFSLITLYFCLYLFFLPFSVNLWRYRPPVKYALCILIKISSTYAVMFGSERLKTEEEKLKEEKEKLERLEADRLRRMRGDLEDATRGAAISVEDMQVGSLSPG
jgi:hypothetical protein